MKLHTNPALFEQAVVAASQKFNIPEIFCEKDYWVTLVLHTIFHSELKDEAVFKGGTALSKCYKLVDRFSEDIDIVVVKKDAESNTQLKHKLKAITEIVNKVIPEVDQPGITNKVGQIRKTAHQYPKRSFSGSFGQVREQIIVEVSCLGSDSPNLHSEVTCYLAQLMKENSQHELIVTYEMDAFPVKVLSKERTFCEKIMSLTRFSFSPNPYTDLANKIRHIYDVHMMLNNNEVDAFFRSDDFEKMLLQVGKDDVVGYKNNNEWLKHHPSSAIIFDETTSTWGAIRSTYQSVFKDLVLGPLPEESDIITTLETISKRIKTMDWKIGIGED